LEDRELVQKLLAKDEEAFLYFYQTYRDRLYRACVHLLGYQDPDAEDITQEVFLAALRHLPKFEFRSSLYHWLNRICMYLCYERVRARYRTVASLDEQLEEAAEPVAFRRKDIEQEEMEKQAMLRVVESQRQLLGDPCRNLLDLREIQKKSYAQMAEVLKVPIGTVMSRLSRCKDALKDLVTRALKEPHRG